MPRGRDTRAIPHTLSHFGHERRRTQFSSYDVTNRWYPCTIAILGPRTGRRIFCMTECVRYVARRRHFGCCLFKNDGRPSGHIVDRIKREQDITVLHLYDNVLHDLSHVCRLRTHRITTVWLGHNRIDDRGVETLVSCRWPQLTHLFLDDNYIGDEGALMLARLPSVTRLGLHTNCLTDVGVSLLRKKKYEILWVHSQRSTASGCSRRRGVSRSARSGPGRGRS